MYMYITALISLRNWPWCRHNHKHMQQHKDQKFSFLTCLCLSRFVFIWHVNFILWFVLTLVLPSLMKRGLWIKVNHHFIAQTLCHWHVCFLNGNWKMIYSGYSLQSQCYKNQCYYTDCVCVICLTLELSPADNSDLGIDNSWYRTQPHPIISYKR